MARYKAGWLSYKGFTSTEPGYFLNLKKHAVFCQVKVLKATLANLPHYLYVKTTIKCVPLAQHFRYITHSYIETTKNNAVNHQPRIAIP
jgi:hypothetical protein